ncbi:MAG: DsbA family protein [Promicromonosporaceae bacterium]|nr:DsbA family protein [Promicromonosporaceae bacterium]
MTLSQQQLTKAQRREAARLEAQRVADLNAARDARLKKMVWGGLGALVVILVGAVLLVTRPWQSGAGVPNFEAVPMSELSHVPANTIADGGFALTAAGGTTSYLNPDIPTVDIYFDYMCSWCAHFEFINQESLEQLVADGEANVVMHPVAILNHFTPLTQFSTRSVAAAGWIADQAPGYFADFHLAMFLNQPTTATGGDMSNAEIAGVAAAVGVPQAVVDGIADGTAVRTFGQWAVSLTQAILDNPAVRTPDGGFGTPTLLIDGVRCSEYSPCGTWEGDWSDPSGIPGAVAEMAAG